MRADNSANVIAAAHRRSQSTHRRAVAALRRMDTTGIVVTFEAVAREADVSRSWLYNQPDLRTEIERLRERNRPGSNRQVPDRQRASAASLQRRLDLASAQNKKLEADNQRLRRALSQALGDRRAAKSGDHRRDTPRQRISPATRPA